MLRKRKKERRKRKEEMARAYLTRDYSAAYQFVASSSVTFDGPREYSFAVLRSTSWWKASCNNNDQRRRNVAIFNALCALQQPVMRDASLNRANPRLIDEHAMTGTYIRSFTRDAVGQWSLESLPGIFDPRHDLSSSRNSLLSHYVRSRFATSSGFKHSIVHRGNLFLCR